MSLVRCLGLLCVGVLSAATQARAVGTAVTFSHFVDVNQELGAKLLQAQSAERALFDSQTASLVSRQLNIAASELQISVADEVQHRRLQTASKCVGHKGTNKCLTIKYVIMCSKGCQAAKAKVDSMKGNVKVVDAIIKGITRSFQKLSTFNGKKVIESVAEQVVASMSQPTVVTIDMKAPTTSTLEYIGSYETGSYGTEETTNVVWEPKRQNVIVLSKSTGVVQYLAIDGWDGHVTSPRPACDQALSNKTRPCAKKLIIDVKKTATSKGVKAGAVTSMALAGNFLVTTVANADTTKQGYFVFFIAETGAYAGMKLAGVQPQGLSVSTDGAWVACVNTGRVSGTNDATASVSVLKFGRSGVDQDGTYPVSGLSASVLTKQKVRLFGTGAMSPEKNLEPVSCAFSSDGATLYVNFQVNNALGSFNVASKKWTWGKGYGYFGAAFDPSDKDSRIQMASSWEGAKVQQMPQPKGIASFTHRGVSYVATANEGASRGDAKRLSAAGSSCPGTAGREMIKDSQLGRLSVSTQLPAVVRADGKIDCANMYTFGSRSFSIFAVNKTSMNVVYNSGSDLETVAKRTNKRNFNNDGSGFDSASDDKGPQPSSISVQNVNGKRLAFIGSMTTSGVFVYDVTDPLKPVFQDYVNHRNWTDATASSGTITDGNGGVNPEYTGLGMDFGVDKSILIPKAQSPTCFPLLVVANCLSGSVSIYQVTERDSFLRQNDGSCMGGSSCSFKPPKNWCGVGSSCSVGCGISGIWSKLGAQEPQLSTMAKTCSKMKKWGTCGMGPCSCKLAGAPKNCDSSVTKVSVYTGAQRGSGTAAKVSLAIKGDAFHQAAPCTTFFSQGLADGWTTGTMESPSYGVASAVAVSVGASSKKDDVYVSEIAMDSAGVRLAWVNAASIARSKPFTTAGGAAVTLKKNDAYSWWSNVPRSRLTQSSSISIDTGSGTKGQVSFSMYGQSAATSKFWTGPYLVNGVAPNSNGRTTWVRFQSTPFGKTFNGMKITSDGKSTLSFTKITYATCTLNDYTKCKTMAVLTGNWNLQAGQSVYVGFK